jgi:hypothetical protein
VHCEAGVSRSATVVAAHLMAQDPSLTAVAAVAKLRLVHPQAHPNDGFMRQLALFRSLGCVVDTAAPLYRHHRLRMVRPTASLRVSLVSCVRQASAAHRAGITAVPHEGLQFVTEPAAREVSTAAPSRCCAAFKALCAD